MLAALTRAEEPALLFEHWRLRDWPALTRKSAVSVKESAVPSARTGCERWIADDPAPPFPLRRSASGEVVSSAVSLGCGR